MNCRPLIRPRLAALVQVWLDHEFSKVVGLGKLKEQIAAFNRQISLDKTRAAQGHAVDGQTQCKRGTLSSFLARENGQKADESDGCSDHMIFRGHRGTGKTGMARLMAKLLYRLEITKTDTLFEVQREDLVGTYAGETGNPGEKPASGLTKLRRWVHSRLLTIFLAAFPH